MGRLFQACRRGPAAPSGEARQGGRLLSPTPASLGVRLACPLISSKGWAWP